MSWKPREEKTVIQLSKDFSLNGFNSEWLGQKSDYIKLRGEQNGGV